MAKGYYRTYTSVKDAIVIEVQKKYEYGCDIATAIRTGKKFDLDALEPVRKESTETDDVKRLHQQGGMDILYQEKLRVH